MATPRRGTKREDPETGKKFYDLDKDPIVSPYTGKSYPRSYFDGSARGRAVPEREAEEEEEVEVEEVVVEPGAPVIVSLEEAETEEEVAGEEIPDVEDVEEVEDIGEDEADVFLEEEEDEEDLDFDVGGDER